MPNIPARKSAEVTQKYAVERNTFKRDIVKNPRRKIDVEIGDIHEDDFMPQFKTKHWDNECNFSLRYLSKDPSPAKVRTTGNKVRYVKQKEEVHFYDLDIDEDGGYEIEIELKEKPDTNIFEFSIKTKGFKFYYQPELTQEKINNGAWRPENVIGSYAVYHETKGGMQKLGGTEYRTGKAFHIYRPKAVDSDGNETWAELSVDEDRGILSVTIPQDYLDSAVYPVLVDPTFGYTTLGASNVDNVSLSSFSWSTMVARSNYTPGEDGTVESISFALESVPGESGDLYVALFEEDGDGANTHDRLGWAISTNVDVSTEQFHTIEVSGIPVTASTPYLLVGFSDHSDIAGNTAIKGDRGPSRTEYRSGGTTWSTLTAIDSWSNSGNPSTDIMSIYATYTTGDGVVYTQVASSSDDARNLDGDTQKNTTVTVHYLGQFSTTNDYWHGYRWNNVTVPQGATINSATVYFYSAGVTAGTTVSSIWYGVDADDAATWNTSTNYPEGATQTTASVTKSFATADWGSAGFVFDDGLDVTSLVQEIVDRGGWSSGNALAIVGHDNGSSSNNSIGFSTYNSDPSRGAIIDIDYSEAVAGGEQPAIFFSSNF